MNGPLERYLIGTKKNPTSFPPKEKYTKDCPSNFQYEYYTTSCHGSCRSLGQPDQTCKVRFTPLDGCRCPKGTFLNDKNKCVPPAKCPCYLGNKVIRAKKTIRVKGKSWYELSQFYFVILFKSQNTPISDASLGENVGKGVNFVTWRKHQFCQKWVELLKEEAQKVFACLTIF